MIFKDSWLAVLVPLTVMPSAYASDEIPEDMSAWTERDVVLQSDTGLVWEEKDGIGVAGVSKVNGVYYLFYLAGFDGCWNTDGDVNHQSLGLATSTDGVNFTKSLSNPLLKPHNFLPVGSHEEGIRTAYIKYIPSKNKFYGYFGVESPGGSEGCEFGGTGSCECDISVDAAVYLATSDDGMNWTNEGSVEGTYSQDGNEVYASGWVHDGSEFAMFVTVAEGGQTKSASKGVNPLNLNELGRVNALDWGWSGVDAYLHDDNNTITLIYNPSGGSHPGSSNDDLYFSTTQISDMTNIRDERVVKTNGVERNIIFRDGDEWKWYYSEESSRNRTTIRLRTHPFIGKPTTQPEPPIDLSVE